MSDISQVESLLQAQTAELSPKPKLVGSKQIDGSIIFSEWPSWWMFDY